ncbi:MAG: hypothetical protein HYY76_05175 [Acidobacteria bacterium]|nr:hypothetical protein [Acidobacteriota bacterium]
MPVARLKAGGGAPEVEIVVGHLHRADFEFWLYDPTGANPIAVGAGKTSDDKPDKFPFPKPLAQLDGHLLWWQAGLVAHAAGPADAPFSVTVRVLQDGHIAGLDGGSGTMERPHTTGMLQLRVMP